jgi:hypothetical protein
LSLFNTSVTALKSDNHLLKSHTKSRVNFVSDLSTKWRSWETASPEDWSIPLEREAVIRRLAEQLRLSQAIIKALPNDSDSAESHSTAFCVDIDSDRKPRHCCPGRGGTPPQ